MIHIVTTWDTESICRNRFSAQACFERDWIDASYQVMETCEKFNVPATFMVNVGEIDYWENKSPNAEDIIKQMHNRGHDVQLHIHTAWCFWWADGKEPYYKPELDTLDDGLRRFPVGDAETPYTQRFFLRKGIDRLQSITGTAPICYRDVHYDINDPRVFYSLYKEGIKSDWTLQKGRMSNLSWGLPSYLVASDPLPNNAYFPDFIEVRKEANKVGWSVLEVPNTVIPNTLQRFDFQVSYKTLIDGFENWREEAKHCSCAILSFLNHQKGEIFDANHKISPWKDAGKKVIENMKIFFEYVQEKYASKKEVKFSKASDAVMDFIRKSAFIPQIPSTVLENCREK